MAGSNTKTTDGRPCTLKAYDCIEVEYTDGHHEQNLAKAWDYSWNTNSRNHIVKYRKLN